MNVAPQILSTVLGCTLLYLAVIVWVRQLDYESNDENFEINLNLDYETCFQDLIHAATN